MNQARRATGPTYFLSLACHHCEQPQCAKACPSGAYEQRDDGVVVHDEKKCAGCRYCEMVCPFGAPRYDETRRIVTKCNYCVESPGLKSRATTSQGEGADLGPRTSDFGLRTPRCIAACPTGALRPLADADSASAARVPGFADRAHARPAVRFIRPRGVRGARLNDFERARGDVD